MLTSTGGWQHSVVPLKARTNERSFMKHNKLLSAPGQHEESIVHKLRH